MENLEDNALTTAPLEHARRQFKQNCLFVFDGAVFLATPSLLTEIQLGVLETEPVVLLDNAGDPHFIAQEQLEAFSLKAKTVLTAASKQFVADKARFYENFEKLLQLTELPDEEIE